MGKIKSLANPADYKLKPADIIGYLARPEVLKTLRHVVVLATRGDDGDDAHDRARELNRSTHIPHDTLCFMLAKLHAQIIRLELDSDVMEDVSFD